MSETENLGHGTTECPACHSQNPGGKRFCSDCGAPLQDAIPAGIQREVERVLSSKLKDAKLVEMEVSQAIVTRLTDWAKLFGFLLGVPLAILAALLGYLGFHTYSDFAASVKLAKEEALKPLEKTKKDATKQYNDLQAQLKQNQTLNTQLQDLSKKVDQIERIVRFKPSASLTPELQQNLEKKFSEYYVYLKRVGFLLEQAPPTVSIDPAGDTQSYYEPPPDNLIVISPDLAQTGAGLHEFTHYVLVALRPNLVLSDPSGLESGLADYFQSSFEDRSDFGREIWQVYERKSPGIVIPPRNLDNHRSFAEVQIGQTEEHSSGNVWGGAFWELRQAIGQETTDKLLLATWKEVDLAKANADLKVFPRELIKQDRILESGTHLKQIRDIFKRRGLEL